MSLKTRKIALTKLEEVDHADNESPKFGILSRIEALKARILASLSADAVEKSSWVRQLNRIQRDLARQSVTAYSPETTAARGEHIQFAGFIGKNPEVLRILEIAARIAPVNLPVLLLGESGTGKELVANIIHLNSNSQRMVTVNCGALPRNLIESELFGHVKGAFTGAVKDRQGKFEIADGGTIFLDEIGDLPTDSQVKLLRTLQFGEIQRVGSDDVLTVAVRLIAATNKDLRQAVQTGQFREDLYYRLRACELYLPPLRDRRDEIPQLLDYFLNRAAAENKTPAPDISPRLRKFLLHEYPFPGNIRELENLCLLMAVLAKNRVMDFDDLPPRFFETNHRPVAGESHKSNVSSYQNDLDKSQRDYLEKLLTRHKGEVGQAYPESGYSRSRFYQLLKKYRLKPRDFQ